MCKGWRKRKKTQVGISNSPGRLEHRCEQGNVRCWLEEVDKRPGLRDQSWEVALCPSAYGEY
jgi:hypothetical protein